MTRAKAHLTVSCPARRALRSALVLWAALLLSSIPARAQTSCALPGNDGPGGTLSGVVNTYYPGTATANSGTTSITLGAARAGGALTPIAAGDLVLVIQMQDAGINSNNSNSYGANNGTGSG